MTSRRSPAWRDTTCRRRCNSATGSRTFGSNAGVNIGNVTTRPTFIINDSLTWTKGEHTLKAGMEYRKIMGNIHANGNQAGTFTFGRGSTGLVGVNSGSPIASFLHRCRRQRQCGIPRGGLRVSASERVDPVRR